MKKSLVLLFSFFFISTLFSQVKYPKVVLKTSVGNMIIELYSETPIHSNNFIKLVNEGFYNDQLFHRVINHFMIQTGDPISKYAKPGQVLGSGGPSYTIPPELISGIYHKRGAIGAARQPDRINPNKESNGSQFYIVQGKVFSKAELEVFLQSGQHIPFTPEQVETYTTIGGAPHLDNQYTVFGELVEGFDVLDLISSYPVDKNSRPLDDIRIIKAYTIK
jgi:cyclophilin family peptidyl-prolyl cis-trans isomerase